MLQAEFLFTFNANMYLCLNSIALLIPVWLPWLQYDNPGYGMIIMVTV